MRLFSYHRNSAGERVRIASHMKGLAYDYVSAATVDHPVVCRLGSRKLARRFSIAPNARHGRVIRQEELLRMMSMADRR